ncbi:IS4 family transposase [Deinococcus hopiensis]|uniref:Transposase DDE domain-containing protein n=1 Tax=Deinococcus hopiensis KR-140 TaxID=695939 RepID=A0A1W1UT52_9DEIO|nr:Transposase DDE domain-containing protein [Deinococcus hopiensis KR-140]
MIRPSAALSHVDTFAAYLKERLPHHRSDTLRRLTEVLFGILQAESTLHRKIAVHIHRDATPSSILRLVARTFHETDLTPQDVTDVLLPLLPTGKLTFVLDRTNWKLGQRDLNLLVLGVALGDVVLPLMWKVLPHGGNSDMRVRMLLVGLLLKRLPARRWAVLIADREFVGQEWFSFLRARQIKRCIRIRENTVLDEDPARHYFQNLKPGEVRELLERVWVYGSWMRVVATFSPQGERLLVASDLSLWNTLTTYRLRWGIECAFSAMKTRGLNLEQTHMTQPDRLSRLFGLLSLALAWMVRVGAWRAGQQPISTKKHARPAISRASYGRELLCPALRWGKTTFYTYLDLLKSPFPAPERQKT